MHLEHVVGSEVRVKILRTLFQEALPQLDAPALAKETGKSLSGVHKALGELAASRVVAGMPRGRTTYYAVDPNHAFYEDLLALFRRERIHDNVPHLFPTYWNHLESVVSALSGYAAVKAIVLFGSFVRAPIYPTADVDVLLVGTRPWQAVPKVMGHEVNVVAMKPDELDLKARARDPFVTGVLERHVILYQAQDYAFPWSTEERSSRKPRGGRSR